MGFFPSHMYDLQINMIRKPFELNKERLIKKFMSPKYENRRKEFFANFLEFLRKAKLHNHPLGFGSVANKPPGVLILQYNHLVFLNW